MTVVTSFDANFVVMMRTKKIPRRRRRSHPVARLAQVPVVMALRNPPVVLDFRNATARILTWVSITVVTLL